MNSGSDEAMASRLTRLEDIESIKQLKHLYAKHMDNGFDMDRVMDLFTEDAVFVRLNTATEYRGYKQIRQYISSWVHTEEWVLHLMTNPIIDVRPDGVSATGAWNLLGLATMAGFPDPSGRDAVILTGTYDDEFQKGPMGWRFQRIALLIHQTSNLDQGWVRQKFRPGSLAGTFEAPK